MKFLNKLYNKLIFSDAPNLNLTAFDMGSSQCSARMGRKGVNRLDVATGTVGSLEIFVPVTLSGAVQKTSPSLKYYKERILKNGYIGGTLTVYDDVNEAYVIDDVSISVEEIPPMNGTEPAVTFQIEGNLRVNEEALAAWL